MIKIFIVEDHQVVIEGICALLQNENDILVTGSANTAHKCMEYLQQNKADVILLDINLPDMNGVDLCKLIKQQHNNTYILALSTLDQGSYMTKIMENGASGYLLKNISKNELIESIKTVAKGGIYFSFEAGKIYKSTLEKRNNNPVLTKREKEILKLIAEGFTNVQIGAQLFISVDTVDSHRKNLHTKLNVKNTAMLIKVAIEEGLL